MKQKGKLFLNIATIALCLCAIIVGVYSAKTASLNVGGQVGFVAHDCKVDVVGKITDASSGGAEGTYYVTEKSSESDSPTLLTSANSAKISLGGTNAQTKLATFGNLMFTYDDNHDPKPIVIEFTITNNSAFDIKATLATSNLNPYDSSKVTISVQNNEAEISPNQSEIVKLTITLDKNISTDVNNVVTGNINFDFEKCVKLLQYNSSIGWHINMGKVTSTLANAVNSSGNTLGIAEGTPIPWVPVIEVTQNNGTTTLTAFNGKLENNKPQKGHTYYFLSFYSLPVVHGNTLAYYITYNFYENAKPYYSWYYSGTGMIKHTSGSSNVSANDYSVSNIRAYLNGNTAYQAATTPNYSVDTSKQLSNFLSLYALDNDPIYTKISSRTLGDLYSSISYSSTAVSVPTITAPVASSANTADKLWLMSYAEWNICKSDTNVKLLMGGYPMGTSTSMPWFLRTPGGSASSVSCVDYYGDNFDEGPAYIETGLRPAFKIVV